MCSRLLFTAVLAFCAGAMIDRLSAYANFEPAPWDFLEGTRTYRWVAAFFGLWACAFVALSVVTADGLGELAFGLLVATLTGLLIWQANGLLSARLDRSARQRFLSRVRDGDLQPVQLSPRGTTDTHFAAFANPAEPGGAVYVPVDEMRRLAAHYEGRRLLDSRFLDLRVSLAPFSKRVELRDERHGVRRARTSPPEFGLVRLDYALRNAWLRLEIADNS